KWATSRVRHRTELASNFFKKLCPFCQSRHPEPKRVDVKNRQSSRHASHNLHVEVRLVVIPPIFTSKAENTIVGVKEVADRRLVTSDLPSRMQLRNIVCAL